VAFLAQIINQPIEPIGNSIRCISKTEHFCIFKGVFPSIYAAFHALPSDCNYLFIIQYALPRDVSFGLSVLTVRLSVSHMKIRKQKRIIAPR